MGKPKAPAAPDPNVTAAAQTQSNIQTAEAQANLDRVNQYGPLGSVTYSNPAQDWMDQAQAQYMSSPGYQNIPAQYQAQTLKQWQAQMTGQDPYGNPDSGWSQTTTITPEEQQVLNEQQYGQALYGEAALNSLSGAYNNLSGQFGDPSWDAAHWALSNNALATLDAQNIATQPINTNYNQVRDQSLQAGLSMLQPQIQMQDEDLRSRLLNSGVTEGSQAWNNAYRQFNQSNNNAYEQNILNAENLSNNAIQQTGMLRDIPLQNLTSYANIADNQSNLGGQAIQQAIAERDVPLNEANALLSGSMVQMPQFQGVPGVPVSGTDTSGITQQGFNNQMAHYNQQMQQYSSGLGGLFSLGGAALALL